MCVFPGAKANLRDYSGHLAFHYLKMKEPDGPEEDGELRERLFLLARTRTFVTLLINFSSEAEELNYSVLSHIHGSDSPVWSNKHQKQPVTVETTTPIILC